MPTPKRPADSGERLPAVPKRTEAQPPQSLAAYLKSRVKGKPRAEDAILDDPPAPGTLTMPASRRPGRPPHLIVTARAGTGKTTTLVEGLKIVRGGKPRITPSPQQEAIWQAMAMSSMARFVGFVAFSNAIAGELKARVPEGCDAMTMHALGFKAVRRAFPYVTLRKDYLTDYLCQLYGVASTAPGDPAGFECPEDSRREQRIALYRAHRAEVNAIKTLVRLAKITLPDVPPDRVTAEQLEEFTRHHDIDMVGVDAARTYQRVTECLDFSTRIYEHHSLDFNDMIYLPIALDLPVFCYHLLLVDEAQDLSRATQLLAYKAGERIVMCGDDRQAIFGFAGSDTDSLDNAFAHLEQTPRGCRRLSLTVTRRCGKAIVREVTGDAWVKGGIVPDFSAFDTNHEGEVRHIKAAEKQVRVGGSGARDLCQWHENVSNEDMVVCRTNAPLVSQCFTFTKLGRRAYIQGRDIGKGLIALVKQLSEDGEGGGSVDHLQKALDAWHFNEIRKEQGRVEPSETKLMAIQDKYECLLVFCQDQTRTRAVVNRIKDIFQCSEDDDDDRDQGKQYGIRLSSIHKAKGLEARGVWLLLVDGAGPPHPMAKTEWQVGQEWNLQYVAITRAIQSLTYVTLPKAKRREL